MLPDGTIILTSPIGRTYTTKPAGALFFPQLAAPIGVLMSPVATSPPSYRIARERAINAARYASDPPPL